MNSAKKCARAGCTETLLTWMDPEYCSRRCRAADRAAKAAGVAAPAWDAKRGANMAALAAAAIPAFERLHVALAAYAEQVRR
ncbi:hypothetical protein L3Q67_01050 [Saccharothrix sp. AJ9571]|nr:hypothetical protein L3Q67_01050 [Saccharothrix sp. AJ9571]